jgi:hypothetical protein
VKVVHRHGNRRLRRVLIILGVLLAGVALAVGSVLLYLRHTCYRLTDSAALDIPLTELDRDEQRKVQKGYERLLQACERRRADRVEFTSRELNGIIGALKELRSAQGRVAVDIVNGQPWVKASIPLSGTGIGFLEGRYLNGEFRLHVQTGSAGLEISIVDAIVKGGSLPVWVMRRIQDVDVMEHVYKDPEWGPRIRQVDGLEFDRDSVVVRTKEGRR